MVLGLCLTSLNTAVRLLTTALVLSVVSGFSLFLCTVVVVLFAILWSWIAGLKTVIWTDFTFRHASHISKNKGLPQR